MKDKLTPELLQRAADAATIEQLNTVIKARDMEIAALKTQVNALRGAAGAIVAYPRAATVESYRDVLTKTPQQCLNTHNESLIRDLFDKKGIITSVGTLVIDSDDAIEYLECIKNER